jgi:RNA polymerase sigma-70 factor (TIGR02943 family)
MTQDTASQTGVHDIAPELIDQVREQMLGFARLQLRDEHLAEDAVQEALVGALRNAVGFRGEAALKTWMFAILKNKIADIIRQRTRSARMSDAMSWQDEVTETRTLFDSRGFWVRQEKPVRWQDPSAAFEDGQFWTIFDACLDHLPPRQSRVFMMRELLELEPNTICAELAITISNLHVLLHRARLALRRCLERNWYAEAPI